VTDDTDTRGHLVTEDSRLTRKDAFLMGVVVGILFMLLLMAIFGGPSDPAGAIPL